MFGRIYFIVVQEIVLYSGYILINCIDNIMTNVCGLADGYGWVHLRVHAVYYYNHSSYSETMSTNGVQDAIIIICPTTFDNNNITAVSLFNRWTFIKVQIFGTIKKYVPVTYKDLDIFNYYIRHNIVYMSLLKRVNPIIESWVLLYYILVEFTITWRDLSYEFRFRQ